MWSIEFDILNFLGSLGLPRNEVATVEGCVCIAGQPFQMGHSHLSRRAASCWIPKWDSSGCKCKSSWLEAHVSPAPTFSRATSKIHAKVSIVLTASIFVQHVGQKSRKFGTLLELIHGARSSFHGSQKEPEEIVFVATWESNLKVCNLTPGPPTQSKLSF